MKKEKTEEKEKKIYKNTQKSSPLLVTISSGCKTPLIQVKFSNLVKPFYYPNSPSIPRYSVTCTFDALANEQFIKNLQVIEENEGVESILKFDKESDSENPRMLVKFQTKNIVPIFIQFPPSPISEELNSEPELIQLEDEFAKNEDIIVVYDILRYTPKFSQGNQHALSFKPTAIYYYPKLNGNFEEIK